MSGKNLAYYLQNPDEMPEDPKILEQLANEHIREITGDAEHDLTIDRFAGEKPDKKDEKASESSDAEAKNVDDALKAAEEAEATKAAEEAAKKEADDAAKAADEQAKAEAEAKAKADAEKSSAKPEGVLAKDGKHVIPYEVLMSTRERAEAAENLAKQQAQEIERLKAEKEGTKQSDATILSEEELEALAEDSPTLAKILKAQQEQIARLNETVTNVESRETESANNAETQAKLAVQEAIDANETLSAWQNDKDQSRWDEAARVDKALRESPLWRGKSFDERFAKVVELTQAIFGETKTPEVKAEVPVDKKPPLTEAEIKAAAEAKLQKKAESTVPVSLSQIPGGTPPAVDEKERVDQMSSVELGNKFLHMSKEELEAYLTSL